MGLPRKLKNINAYGANTSYLGVIGEYEEPKLALSTDDWRGGGMLGPVKIDKGLEAMEATLTMGGHTAGLIRTFGTTDVAGVPLRLVGAYQADDGTPAQSVEIYLGGRFTEIDLGKAKAGDDTEHKYKVAVAYYRRVVDGVEEVEIDMLAGVFRVDGIDRQAEIMAILTG
ncbi:MAG: phage major tail tube protein [Novosphingobium aromaticivorans]|jgi:P2 family phage contractile tail tube protein|nr:phage major tail tube protein [Novosphingobium aromaticivorans]